MDAQNPWLRGDMPRGEGYDQRFAALEASGQQVHGEADFVSTFTPSSVLDAGCGTGRVAIELARRGVDVMGVDLDEQMLSSARAKAPELPWLQGDLADPQLELGRSFHVVVAAGNVMIFLTPGTEGSVVSNLARHVEPNGLLIAGFQLGPRRLSLDVYDRCAAAAGLALMERWATWDREPFVAPGDYAVSVHRPL